MHERVSSRVLALQYIQTCTWSDLMQSQPKLRRWRQQGTQQQVPWPLPRLRQARARGQASPEPARMHALHPPPGSPAKLCFRRGRAWKCSEERSGGSAGLRGLPAAAPGAPRASAPGSPSGADTWRAGRRAALLLQILAPPWLQSVFDSVSDSLRHRAGAQVARSFRLPGMSAQAASGSTPGGEPGCPPGSAPLRRAPAGARGRAGAASAGRAPGAGPGGTPGAGPRSRFSACRVLWGLGQGRRAWCRPRRY